MATASADFIAAGGNRHSSAADYDSVHDILAFGADRNIALCRLHEPFSQGIYKTLQGHEGMVNAVKFFRPHDESNGALLTGANDKTIRIWLQEGKDFGDGGADRVIAQKASINTFGVLRSHDKKYSRFASAAAEPFVKIWDSTGSPQQEISLTPSYLPLTLDFSYIASSDSVILAAAGTSPYIHIFASLYDQVHFKPVACLSGHEGWIRSLSFRPESPEDDQNHNTDVLINGSSERCKDSDVLLASASQDKYVRLWRFHHGTELPAVSQASKDPLLGSVGKALSNKPHRFHVNDEEYSITFEALLIGHDDWIYTAEWVQSSLLTASADNSLALWEHDSTSGLWNCSTRLGEINSQKGATTATGSSGGYWIGLGAGQKYLSLGRTGAWRVWNHSEDSRTCRSVNGLSGHTREVRSLTWSKDGSFLLTTGADQTTRLFGEWKRDGHLSWHELSRPQVHGYDLNCIDTLDNNEFVSGADEKLLRVFAKPQGVADVLSAISRIEEGQANDLPKSAQIPVMGLSNKATDVGEASFNEANRDSAEEPAQGSAPLDIKMPPLEDELGRHLLWPETEKLYGHGYEISTVAASNDGSIIATACRASSIDHAVIRLYETKTWQEIKPPLKAHTLTVTSLTFSSSDGYLLSVGRDRQCCLWKLEAKETQAYRLLFADAKAHSRMILDVSCFPQVGLGGFVTAGRDKRLRVWGLKGDGFKLICEVPFEHPVTAIASSSEVVDGLINVAAGLEDGSLFIVQVLADTLEIRGSPLKLPKTTSPSKAVTSLAWRPCNLNIHPDGQRHERAQGQLAIGSEDTSVRILSVTYPYS